MNVQNRLTNRSSIPHEDKAVQYNLTSRRLLMLNPTAFSLIREGLDKLLDCLKTGWTAGSKTQ